MTEALFIIAFAAVVTGVVASIVSWVEFIGTWLLQPWSFETGPTAVWGAPKIRRPQLELPHGYAVRTAHTKAKILSDSEILFRAKLSVFSLSSPVTFKGRLTFDDDGAWVTARIPLYSTVMFASVSVCALVFAVLWELSGPTSEGTQFALLALGGLFLTYSTSWVIERRRFQRSVDELRAFLETDLAGGAAPLTPENPVVVGSGMTSGRG